MPSLENGPDKRRVKDIVSVPCGGFGSMGTRWKKMMKKHTKSTSCLCSALPRALINSGRQGDEGSFPQTAPPSRMRFSPSLPCCLSFLNPQRLFSSFSTFPTALLGFLFCTLWRFLFQLSPMTSKFLAKSCCGLFCGFLEESLVYGLHVSKAAPCVSASPLLVEL